MVDSRADLREIDPHEAIRVREIVKDLTPDQVDLHIKPTAVVDKPQNDIEKLTCLFCASISIDAI